MASVKNPVGRPRKFQSVAQMQKAIDAYFKDATKGEFTITGLALDLGFLSRQALINYEGYAAEFHDAIKKAKLRIEQDYEKSLRRNGKAGEIFGLKNFGWSDRQEVEHSFDEKQPLVIVRGEKKDDSSR